MAPTGNSITLPWGVNTYTSSVSSSILRLDMNSAGSDVSDCQSTMRDSQAISCDESSLYSQWAATPCSARSCIALVRICTSSVLP